MTEESVLEGRLCRILAEAEERYRHELLPEEERLLLEERIRRIRRRLAKVVAS